jgi:hypothetical protein
MSFEWLLLAFVALLAWSTWDNLQKREIALRAARAVCQRAGVQFLDDSVALSKIKLRRDSNQRAQLYREFSFEYSSVGDDRQAGRVYLLGEKLLSADLIA